MMRLGFSRPWPEALEGMTGSGEMSAGSFIKYFLPLYDFLAQENDNNNECIGWGGKYC
jgi:peptidyl-dipeptidase A